MTRAGAQLLVEVKSVAPSDTLRRQKISRHELAGLTRYADWTQAQLLVGHYWSRLNLWTLVKPEVFVADAAGYSLSIEEALPANELGSLGDRWIATVPPLVLSLIPDATDVPVVARTTEARELRFTIARIEISCGGRRLRSSLEKEIAFHLILLGDWPTTQSVRVGNDGKLERLDYELTPERPDDAPDQECWMIGTLSSMYSKLYNLTTLTEQGEPSALRREPQPGRLREIIPRDYWDRPHRALPLWQFLVSAQTANLNEGSRR